MLSDIKIYTYTVYLLIYRYVEVVIPWFGHYIKARRCSLEGHNPTVYGQSSY